jgi:cation diffusion facilitator family transporter
MEREASIQEGVQATLLAMVVNVILGISKIFGGILGHSQALIADGIESTADVFNSAMILLGLRIATQPSDSNHPYGHGRAEPLAGIAAALWLIGAAIFILIQSIQEIQTPQKAPAPFTLAILVIVIFAKTILFKYIFRLGRSLQSTALQGDAWHHYADVLTSTTAFLGISISLLAGPGWESADDWAAILACCIIAWNGIRLGYAALSELMDVAPPEELHQELKRLAEQVPGVVRIEKCRIRKAGFHLLMDIHIQVNPKLNVADGHRIAHQVKEELCNSSYRVHDVVTHVEPADAFT